MAHPTQAQFFGVQQANLDLFLALVGPLARGAEKINELNMQAVKTSLADTTNYVRESSQQPVGAGMSGLKPELANGFAQKMNAYAGHMNEIFASTGAEFAQEAQRQMSTYATQTQEAMASFGQNLMSSAGGAFPASGAGTPSWVAAYETAMKPMRDAFEKVMPATAAK